MAPQPGHDLPKVVVRRLRKEYIDSRDFLSALLQARLAGLLGQKEPWLAQHKNACDGQTCFVLGNGPSLKNFSPDILGQLPSFGTNGVFLHFVPTFFVTISTEFYKNYVKHIRNLQCHRKFIGSYLTDIITHTESESLLNCSWNVYGSFLRWNLPVPMRFSTRADRVVYLGGSVLFVCLQLAYWLGFAKVILLGVDHDFGLDRSELVYGGTRLVVGKKDRFHFSKDYLRPETTAHCDMLATERAFRLALEAFQTSRREIVNATPSTKLEMIPKVELEDVL